MNPNSDNYDLLTDSGYVSLQIPNPKLSSGLKEISQYCPKYFQIRKKALKINSNMCFFFNIFLNTPVINCRKNS